MCVTRRDPEDSARGPLMSAPAGPGSAITWKNIRSNQLSTCNLTISATGVCPFYAFQPSMDLPFLALVWTKPGFLLMKSTSGNRHLHAPVGADYAPCRPSTLLRAQHINRARNLTRETRSPRAHVLPHDLIEPLSIASCLLEDILLPVVLRQRSSVHVRLVDLPERLARLGVHVAPGRSRVHAIDGGP